MKLQNPLLVHTSVYIPDKPRNVECKPTVAQAPLHHHNLTIVCYGRANPQPGYTWTSDHNNYLDDNMKLSHLVCDKHHVWFFVMLIRYAWGYDGPIFGLN